MLTPPVPVPTSQPLPDFWTWVVTGNASGYLAGVIAAVALFFAIRSSNASRRSATIAQTQLTRLEEEREREQSDLFHAWEVVISPQRMVSEKPVAPDAQPLYYDHVYNVRFNVQNQSRSPIYAVVPYLKDDSDAKDSKRYALGTIAHVPPGVDEPTTYFAYTVFPHKVSTSATTFGFIFEDARHRVWERNSMGVGRQLDAEEGKKIAAEAILNSTRAADGIGWKRTGDQELLFRPRPL